MGSKIEIERKYDVPDGFRLPDLSQVPGVAGVGAPVEHRLDATYFDTPELSLARNKVTLRRRIGGGDAGWHLKRPAGGGDREETQAPLGDPHAPPPDVVSLVDDLVAGAPLRSVARIRTTRTERPIHDADGRVLAVLADDRVNSQTPGEWAVLQRWREIEVELVDGPRDALDAIDRVLRAAGAVPSGAGSKLARALGDRLPAPAADEQTPADDGETTTSAEQTPATLEETPATAPAEPTWPRSPLTAYLEAQHRAVRDHDAGVRAGDADAVHDMRVATRRLRSTLRTFAPILDPALVGGLDGELKWLAETLGKVRDLDVLADRLAAAVGQLPAELVIGPVAERIRERLAAQAAPAREALVAALDSDRFADLTRSVAALAERGQTSEVGQPRLRRLARKAVARADRRLAAADEREAGTPEREELLHDARKAYKRARYAVEVVAPEEGDPARRLVKRLTRLQDVLGAHQDAATADDRLLDLAAQAHLAGENAFTYGVLHAEQRLAGARSLEDLPAARAKAADPDVRAWLDRR
jgi:CHAD domain-containing protein